MEQFIWETPEELDQKLAQRVRKIRKRRQLRRKISIYKRSELRLNQKIRNDRTNFPVIFNEIAIALDLADELRNIFTQVPYKDIQEVINETR